MNEHAYLKRMPTKDLLGTLRKIRKEKEHKKVYGNYGTGRWVSSSEFQGRSGLTAIKEEVERRKRKGLVSKTAGKPRKSRQQGLFGGRSIFG